VAEIALDVLQGEPLREQKAGGSVPEVVNTDMRQLVPAEELPELPVGIPRIDRCPARRREKPGSSRWPGSQPSAPDAAEVLEYKRWGGEGPSRGGRLRLDERETWIRAAQLQRLRS